MLQWHVLRSVLQKVYMESGADVQEVTLAPNSFDYLVHDFMAMRLYSNRETFYGPLEKPTWFKMMGACSYVKINRGEETE